MPQLVKGNFLEMNPVIINNLSVLPFLAGSVLP